MSGAYLAFYADTSLTFVLVDCALQKIVDFFKDKNFMLLAVIADYNITIKSVQYFENQSPTKLARWNMHVQKNV